MSSKRKFIIRAIKNKSSTSQGQNPVPMEDQDLATAYESLLAESAVLGKSFGFSEPSLRPYLMLSIRHKGFKTFSFEGGGGGFGRRLKVSQDFYHAASH